MKKKQLLTACIAGLCLLAGLGALNRPGLGRPLKNAEPISRSGFLLNTFVTVTLYDTGDDSILDDTMALCKEYENIFSKTVETSEVYKLNHRPKHEQTLPLSDDAAALIKKGLEYCEKSKGAFDITIEPVSSLWDFTSGEKTIPPESEIFANVKKVGYKNLELDGNTLTFLSPDTSIDLGAIAKGYIADRLGDYLKGRGVGSAIINLGGNVLCIGNRPDGTPFRIGLQKPFADRKETAAVLNISGMSVVASGVYERHFFVGEKNYHHILSPSTGYPYDNGLISVTILSEKSVDGDGLSTACFSLGLEKGLRLVNSLEGVYAYFITDDYKIHYSDGAENFIAE